MARTVGATESRSRLRRFRQDELREKFQGIAYILELEKIGEELKEMDGKDRDRLEVLKIRIDLNMKRLKKILPDEQYMEIDANVSGELGVRKVVVEGIKTKDA